MATDRHPTFAGIAQLTADVWRKRHPDLTTDEKEGRRQAEVMKPEPFKMGDKVRLAAGGDRIMTVVEMQDYGNQVVCEWDEPMKMDEIFPVSSLVRVEPQASGK